MLWKLSFWITVSCVVPYAIYFGFNRGGAVGWGLVLALGLALAWLLMYLVLFKAIELPKKTT
jgi:hypothetical protein